MLMLLVAVSISSRWTVEATPGVVTLTQYTDQACTVVNATSVYNLNNFATPDIAAVYPNQPSCVANNVSTAAANPMWSQVEVACQVYQSSLSINFRARFFPNNTGCSTQAN